MTVIHDIFTLNRDYPLPRPALFRFWSEPELKRRWFAENDGPGWETLDYGLDFRIGGREWGTWRMRATEATPLAGKHTNETAILDILPDARIILAYTMAMDGQRHSASLLTVTFADHGGGTRLTLVEQIAVFDMDEKTEHRKAGWVFLLDGLGAAVKGELP